MLAQFCSNSHPAVSAKGLPNSASGLKNARNTGRFHFPSVDVTLTRPNSTRVLYFTHPPPCRCRILTAPPICGYIMIHTDHFISFHIIHLDPEGPAKIFTTKRPWLPTTFSAPHSLRCPDPASTSSQCHDGPTGRPSFVALCQGFCDTWWPLVTCAWILTKSTVKVLKPELLRLDNIVNHRFQPFFAIFWVLQTTEFWETCEVGLGWSRPLIGDLPGRPGISMGFPWDFHGLPSWPPTMALPQPTLSDKVQWLVAKSWALLTLDLTNNWLWSKSDTKRIQYQSLTIFSNPKLHEQNSATINALWIPRNRSCNPTETAPAFKADAIWRHGRKPVAVTVALDYSWSWKSWKHCGKRQASQK